ncbi:MAG: helix-turn-helix transcriptional regulator [Microbacteriaceae bacterium]|nr:helix-turn-helix transcriptional regulator [Microbacteriaceae bacterium]
MTRREVEYTWRVREIMARRHLFLAKDIAPLLHERGITLTTNAIWRIIRDDPERISLKLLVALADALEVSIDDLVTFTAHDAKSIRTRRAAGNGLPDLRDYRPVRARIIDDDDDGA